MNLSSRQWWPVLLAGALWLTACQEHTETPAPPAPSAAPTAPPAAVAPPPASDQWIGQWNGPEGTYLSITGEQGHYDVTIRNLDGARTFAGTAAGGDRIEFERDGQTEVLRASNGEQTGMKWLSTKKDCLTVRAGEGYCRD